MLRHYITSMPACAEQPACYAAPGCSLAMKAIGSMLRCAQHLLPASGTWWRQSCDKPKRRQHHAQHVHHLGCCLTQPEGPVLVAASSSLQHTLLRLLLTQNKLEQHAAALSHTPFTVWHTCEQAACVTRVQHAIASSQVSTLHAEPQHPELCSFSA